MWISHKEKSRNAFAIWLEVNNVFWASSGLDYSFMRSFKIVDDHREMAIPITNVIRLGTGFIDREFQLKRRLFRDHVD